MALEIKTVVSFNGPLVRAQVAFGKHLSLRSSFSREMPFHFDQVEKSCPMQRVAGFRVLACMWLRDFQKRGHNEPSESPMLSIGSTLAAWLSCFVFG